VTGGSGFIGSAFIKRYFENYQDALVINLDSLTYAGSVENTKLFNTFPNYKFVKGDIQNTELIEYLLKEHKITHVVNFAAESHVDRSIANPGVFLDSNVNGTLQLLQACYKTWMNGPNKYFDSYKENIFLQVSTDEVYGTLDIGDGKSFTETSNYSPNSPYSASKAAAELFVRSFEHTYGMKVLTTSCSNNYGERQNKEKLIPHTITRALSGQSITIHGKGNNIRDWLYVEDHCDAIISVLHSSAPSGSKYNIGGETEKTNIDVVRSICNVMDELHPCKGSYHDLITFVSDRPGNDLRYSVDITKIQKDLGWTPNTTFEKGIKKVVQWYIDNIAIVS
jgi:dTDP-glucose 4,6-dehydratase